MTAEPRIRPIEARDEAALSRLLRTVMSEFGAFDPEDPSADPEIGAIHTAYGGDRSAYFVAERDGEILGGAGITPFGAAEGVCVLRKMYLAAGARGLGLGRALLEACLDAARGFGFSSCYLETMPSMTRARSLYEAAGFVQRDAAYPGACASRCSSYYEREL